MQPKNEKAPGTDTVRCFDSEHRGWMAQHLINTMPLGIVAFDTALRITDSNASADRMLASDASIAEALDKGTQPPRESGWEVELGGVLAGSEPRTFERVSYSKNGVLRILNLICTPLIDPAGRTRLGGTLLIEDVTEKTMMVNDLAAAERLAAVGKLAAKVAHELNNPLDGILRYINLSLRMLNEQGDDSSVHYLQESRKGLLRMVQIISELLEFSRSTYSAMEEADINKIIEDAVKAMTQTAGHRVTIHREYSPDMPNVRSGNLFQVFCNLIKNAFDSMPEGGDLTIRSYCDDHSVVVTFSDTGTGMSKEVLAKLFEPFFTTKDTKKGTGLGLAICREIVERYNGRIWADNRPEGGSVFTVSIPLERTSYKKA